MDVVGEKLTFSFSLILTHNICVVQTLFLPSKWNLYPKSVIFGLKKMMKSGLKNNATISHLLCVNVWQCMKNT